MCKRVSEAIQKEQSDVLNIPHLARFWKGISNVSHCKIENIFRQVLLWHWPWPRERERECFEILVKSEPWQVSWLLSLFSCPQRKSLRTSYWIFLLVLTNWLPKFIYCFVWRCAENSLALDERDRWRIYVKTKFISGEEDSTQCSRNRNVKPFAEITFHYRINVFTGKIPG